MRKNFIRSLIFTGVFLTITGNAPAFAETGDAIAGTEIQVGLPGSDNDNSQADEVGSVLDIIGKYRSEDWVLKGLEQKKEVLGSVDAGSEDNEAYICLYTEFDAPMVSKKYYLDIKECGYLSFNTVISDKSDIPVSDEEVVETRTSITIGINENGSDKPLRNSSILGNNDECGFYVMPGRYYVYIGSEKPDYFIEVSIRNTKSSQYLTETGFIDSKKNGTGINIAAIQNDTKEKIWYSVYEVSPGISNREYYNTVRQIISECEKTGGKYLWTRFKYNISVSDASKKYIVVYKIKSGKKISYTAQIMDISPSLPRIFHISDENLLSERYIMGNAKPDSKILLVFYGKDGEVTGRRRTWTSKAGYFYCRINCETEPELTEAEKIVITQTYEFVSLVTGRKKISNISSVYHCN